MNHPATLVIDIGGTHIKFAGIDGARRQTLGRHVPTSTLRNADPVGSLARIIAEAARDLNMQPAMIVSTVPGFLAPDRDLVHFAGNIPELNGRRFRSELSERTALPVVLERDAIMMLRGEWLAGAAQGARNLLGIFFGTGVGAAFLQNGVPFRGSGYALEIGNMPFRGEGRTLEGMRTDCLEAYVSGRVLTAIAERHGVALPEIFVLADHTRDLRRDIDEFLRDLAIATGIGVALFSPDTILLGGGVAAMKGFPKNRIAALIEANAPFREMGQQMDLRWSSLGWEAVLHGAQLTASEATTSAGA